MVLPRRLVALGVTAFLLAGAGFAVAATREDSTQTATDAPPASEPTVVTPSSTVPPTTSTVPVTTTSTPRSTRSTAMPTTIRRTTTTAPRATATTTTTPAVALCTPAQIVVTIATDKPTYGRGQEVKVTSALRNRSSTTCFYNGYGFRSEFRSEPGDTFPGVSVIADSFAEVPLGQGETIIHSARWDHRLCPEPTCGSLPAGTYTAAVTWNFAGATYGVTTTFILT